MAIFGIGKDEDYEDEEGLMREERKSDKKLTKKFKDLNPRNKRKRKEPPKPWGKKERLFVLGILVVTFGAAMIFTIVARGLHIFAAGGFNLSKINLESLNPFKEETVEIGK